MQNPKATVLVTPKPAMIKTQHETSQLKFCEEFSKEIGNEEENVNDEKC